MLGPRVAAGPPPGHGGSGGQKTCLSLPLRSSGAAQGILRLTTVGEERQFTADEIELVEALAESASAAIHNARLVPRAGGGERAAARPLLGQPPPQLAPSTADAVVAAVEEGAGKLLAGAPRARVWLRDADGRVVAAAGDGG